MTLCINIQPSAVFHLRWSPNITVSHLFKLFLLCWHRGKCSLQLRHSLLWRLQAIVKLLGLGYTERQRRGLTWCWLLLQYMHLGNINTAHLPDFCLAACCVYCNAVCSSDFSDTSMPIVWMWTLEKSNTESTDFISGHPSDGQNINL